MEETKPSGPDRWLKIVIFGFGGVVLTAIPWWVLSRMDVRSEAVLSTVIGFWAFLVLPMLIKGRLGCLVALPTFGVAVLMLVLVWGNLMNLIDGWSSNAWAANAWAVVVFVILTVLLLFTSAVMVFIGLMLGMTCWESRRRPYGELSMKIGEGLNKDISRPTLPP